MLHITQKPPSRYALPIWYGAIGGAALATDPDPNVTPPAANRIIKLSAKRGGLLMMGGSSGLFLRVMQVGGLNVGTNISCVAWLWDDTQAKWIQHGTLTNITGTNDVANLGGVAWGCMPGARIFVQITANAGSTPLLGLDHN